MMASAENNKKFTIASLAVPLLVAAPSLALASALLYGYVSGLIQLPFSPVVVMCVVFGIPVFTFFAVYTIRQSILSKVVQLKSQVQDMVEHPDTLLNVPRSPEDVVDLALSINRLAERISRSDKKKESTIRNEVKAELSAEKARMEAFLRGIGDGISIVDRDMKIIWMNDTLQEQFGDQVGQHCFKIFEHKDNICGGCPVQQALETGRVHQSLRRMYTKNGRLRYFESTGSPIKDESGNIVAGIELARDVTQRIKLERSVSLRSRELSKANEELHKANDEIQSAYLELKEAQGQLLQSEKLASLGTLVAGIAHEINNPINFVYGSMKLMDDNLKALLDLVSEVEKLAVSQGNGQQVEQIKESLDYEFVQEDIRKIVKNVTTGAERVKEIVENLRTFSRTDATTRSLVDLREGIDSTLSLLYHEYKNRIEIIKEFERIPQLPGHPGKLNQVFMNILHNAIQSIEGDGSIWIRTRAENGNAVLEIQDSGKGIDKKHLNNIFDPFFTTKAVGKGTGLGLSISYSIIKDHGGRIDVASQIGQGTRFTITLPLEAQPKQEMQ